MWVISLLLGEMQLKVKFSSRVQVFVCLFYLLETSILRYLNIVQVQIYMEYIPPWCWLLSHARDLLPSVPQTGSRWCHCFAVHLLFLALFVSLPPLGLIQVFLWAVDL